MIQLDPHIQALIFDCDGTLADTIPAHLKAYQDVLTSLGLRVPNAFLVQQAGYPDAAIMAKVKEVYGGKFDPAEAARIKDKKLLEKYLDQVEPIEPVLAILRQYYGKLPVAIATAGSRERTLRFLKAIEATELYDVLVCLEGVEHGKPEPDLFLEAAKQLKVVPEVCHVFKHTDTGIKATRRAGISVTDVRPLNPGHSRNV